MSPVQTEPEPLSSNVANYLVWRYLQESGFTSTASDFARNWIEEPDALPFAKNVNPRALLEIIQNGLYLDYLQAEALQEPKRFDFGKDHGERYPVHHEKPVRLPEVEEEVVVEEVNGNVPDGPRRKTKKKKKQSQVAVEPQVNGDAMEVEIPNGTHAPSRPESEALISDAETPVEEMPLPSTLESGTNEEAQTERVKDLAPDTTTVRIPKPGEATDVHWNPEHPIMLVTGRNVLGLFHAATRTVVTNTGSDLLPIHLSYNNYTVTAFDWRGPDEAIIALQAHIMNEKSEELTTEHLIVLRDAGSSVQELSTIEGTIWIIKWNASSQLLLTVNTTSIVKVWPLDSEEKPLQHQAAFDIRGAVWIGDKDLAVCGRQCIKILRVQDDQITEAKVFDFDESFTWDKIRFDRLCKIIACVSHDGSALALVHLEKEEVFQKDSIHEPILDLEFQPLPSAEATQTTPEPRLLATLSGYGKVTMWNASSPFDVAFTIRNQVELTTCFAFSPEGLQIAIGGPNTISVWDAAEEGLLRAMWKCNEWALPDVNGHGGGIEPEYQLYWDSKGKKLAYANGNKLAVSIYQR